MSERQAIAPAAVGPMLGVVAGFIACGAVAVASPAAADPDAVNPGPGQPVAESPSGQLGAPAPPVPEIANPVYGRGQGPLGALRDLWQQVREGPMTMPGAETVAPPPGAGPAPPLPPGYVSMNAPGSETPTTSTGPTSGGPPLPPGYYPLNGPPPPGYEFSDAAQTAGPVSPGPR